MPRRRGLLSPSLFLLNGAIYKGFLGGAGAGWPSVRHLRSPRREEGVGKTEETIALETRSLGQFVRIEAIATDPPPARAPRRPSAQRR
jgi:hypothetical protein